MEVTKQVWQSEVQTIDFEKVLVVMEGLSRGFIPGSKKRKFMLDYDSEERSVHFAFFKVNGEAEDESQLEKMEMIKFRRYIKCLDDLKGTGLEPTIVFSVQRESIEKMLKSVPCLAEKIRLEKKVRVIADYDPQQKEVVFRHYKVKSELTQKNDKQAAEYIRRLANEELPEMEIEVNYSESKIAESDG